MAQARTRNPNRIDCAIVAFSFPPRLGGLEAYLARLAGALNERISVAVLAPNEGEARDADFAFPVIRRPMLAPLIFKHEGLYRPLYPIVGLLIGFWTFAVFLRRRPRVICSGMADFAWAIAIAAKLLGADFCFICHGKDGHVNPGLFPWLVKRIPLMLAMRWSKVVFANSQFTARLLDPKGKFAEKMQILPVPVGAAREEPTLREAAKETIRTAAGGKLPIRARIILSVGRLREHKGFQHVIDALALIAPEFPELRYVIAGEGPFEGELRKRARERGVEDQVLFVGPQRPPDGFYALAEVFLTVTWEVADEPEGFGMVFIEAGGYGVPSISGNTGGMPEAVINEVTGFCVSGARPEAIADALGRLLREEGLRRRMGEGARRHAEGFAPERVAAIFLEKTGLGG